MTTDNTQTVKTVKIADLMKSNVTPKEDDIELITDVDEHNIMENADDEISEVFLESLEVEEEAPEPIRKPDVRASKAVTIDEESVLPNVASRPTPKRPTPKEQPVRLSIEERNARAAQAKVAQTNKPVIQQPALEDLAEEPKSKTYTPTLEQRSAIQEKLEAVNKMRKTEAQVTSPEPTEKDAISILKSFSVDNKSTTPTNCTPMAGITPTMKTAEESPFPSVQFSENPFMKKPSMFKRLIEVFKSKRYFIRLRSLKEDINKKPWEKLEKNRNFIKIDRQTASDLEYYFSGVDYNSYTKIVQIIDNNTVVFNLTKEMLEAFFTSKIKNLVTLQQNCIETYESLKKDQDNIMKLRERWLSSIK